MTRKIAIFSILLFLPPLAQAEGTKFLEVKLPFENAIIEYSISGVEEGVETLYLRNYGNTTARYHHSIMHVMGIEKVTETVEFIDPQWIYNYDLQEQTGTKTTNPKEYLDEEYNLLDDSARQYVLRNSKELGMGILLGGVNGEFEENAETILNIGCDKTTFMGTTVYTIHDSNIPLRTESNILGMVTLIEAISVKEGLAPENYFLHPQGIVPVFDHEADAVSRSLAHETIRKLNDSEATEKTIFTGTGHQLQPDAEEQQDMEEAIEALKNIFEK